MEKPVEETSCSSDTFDFDPLEKILAATHIAMDAMLVSLRELVRVVQHSNIMFQPDLLLEKLDLLQMSMPEQYTLTSSSNSKPLARRSSRSGSVKTPAIKMNGLLLV